MKKTNDLKARHAYADSSCRAVNGLHVLQLGRWPFEHKTTKKELCQIPHDLSRVKEMSHTVGMTCPERFSHDPSPSFVIVFQHFLQSRLFCCWVRPGSMLKFRNENIGSSLEDLAGAQARVHQGKSGDNEALQQGKKSSDDDFTFQILDCTFVCLFISQYIVQLETSFWKCQTCENAESVSFRSLSKIKKIRQGAGNLRRTKT